MNEIIGKSEKEENKQPYIERIDNIKTLVEAKELISEMKDLIIELTDELRRLHMIKNLYEVIIDVGITSQTYHIACDGMATAYTKAVSLANKEYKGEITSDDIREIKALGEVHVNEKRK
jgi:hypothetical protein